MSIYPNAVRDTRIREYLPPTRVLKSEVADHPERLLRDSGPQVYLYHYDADTQATVLHPGGMVLMDFGVELHGGVRINIFGLGGRGRLRFGESVSEALGQPNQDHAIHDTELLLPNNGMLEYGNTGFRFVSLVNTGDKDLKLFGIHAVALYRDLELAGSFESSDERLNNIWQTAAYTLHLNMQDYIYDGIKRDRLVWMGDMHPEVRGILAAYNDVSLVEKSLNFMLATTNPEKGMNDCWTYSMWYVLCLRDYYWATGKREYLYTHREFLLELQIRLESFIADDGTEHVTDIRFLDWPTRENEVVLHAGIQGLLLWTFQALEELLSVFEKDTSITVEVQEKLKRHIPDCAGNKSAAALQTISGLCDRRNILEDNPCSGVSTFFGFYILLAKETIPALDLIRRYWGSMLDFGATTFWEDFDLEWTRNAGRIDELPVPGKKDLHADFGAWCYKGLRHSLCHGWSCGPLPFLSERILGVRFLEPGGGKIQVTPDDGGLEYVKGCLPTQYGTVTVEKKSSGKWEVDAPSKVKVVTLEF